MALTEHDLARLLPEERLAFTMAAQMVGEDRNPAEVRACKGNADGS